MSPSLSSSSSSPTSSPSLSPPPSPTAASGVSGPSARCHSPPLRRLRGSPGSSKPWNSLVLPATASQEQPLPQDPSFMLDDIFSPSLARIQEETHCTDSKASETHRSAGSKKRPPLLQAVPSSIPLDAPQCAGIRDQRREQRSGGKVGWRPELSMDLCSRPLQTVPQEPPAPRGSLQEAEEGLEALEHFSQMMSGLEGSGGGLDFFGFTTGLLDLALGGAVEDHGFADSDMEEKEEEVLETSNPGKIVVRPPSQPKSARTCSRPHRASAPAPVAPPLAPTSARLQPAEPPAAQQHQQPQPQPQPQQISGFTIAPPSAPAPARRPKVAGRSLQAAPKESPAASVANTTANNDTSKTAVLSAMALDLGLAAEVARTGAKVPPARSPASTTSTSMSASTSLAPAPSSYALPNAWSIEETLSFDFNSIVAATTTATKGKSSAGGSALDVSPELTTQGSLSTPRKASLLPAIATPRPGQGASNWRVGPLPQEDRWFR